MKYIFLILAMFSLSLQAQDYKKIYVHSQGLKEEPISLRPGDSIIRDYVFTDSFVNPVSYMGASFDDSTLTAAEIKVFNGSMTVTRRDGSTYSCYHAEGSLQWNTIWDSSGKAQLTDLRGCTVRLILGCKNNKRTTVITRIKFFWAR
jgi:hypothetical protein